MSGPNRPRTGEQIEKAEWLAEAVRLAIQGWSIRKIAAKVGRSKSTVAEGLSDELEARRPDPKEVDLARKLKSERLYRQLRFWRKKALAGEGSTEAGYLVAKLEELIARLEGTDAPKRTEITGANGGPLTIQDYTRLTDEQLEALAAGKPLPDADGSDGGEGEGDSRAETPPADPGDGGVEG